MKLTITAYVVIGLAVALALSITGNVVQHYAHAATATKLDALNGDVDAVLLANESYGDATAELSASLFECYGGKTQAEVTLNRVTDERNDAWAERDTALERLRATRGKIYATDEACRAWAAQPVCRAVTRELWDQWPRSNEARNR